MLKQLPKVGACIIYGAASSCLVHLFLRHSYGNDHWGPMNMGLWFGVPAGLVLGVLMYGLCTNALQTRNEKEHAHDTEETSV